MTTDLLSELNPEQQQAVSAPEKHLLILAGAGSGKTRVLVHRIAWLIEQERISPYGVLAVTFTNKAAHEMRHRVEAMLGMPTQGMWIGTFHGIAHRILRTHWQEAGLVQNFQILDSDDQLRVIKRVMRELHVDEKELAPRLAQWFINQNKDEGVRSQHCDDKGQSEHQWLRKIYEEYEIACQTGGMIDFAEMLLRVHELLRDQPQVLQHFQQRFQFILVDEFQDTNTIQYAWLKQLASDNATVMIVGDDDQSIYGWRGAKIENIHRFSKDFPDTRVIRLEQNYRSTSTILEAANAVIQNNDSRMGKELWTESEKGDPISVYRAFNEMDEARFIVDQIDSHHRLGTNYREQAILYRSNAQSRVFEEALLRARIPYRVYGGMRFYERAEIKDAMGYLRLISSRDDDSAFERVVNNPPRGIGEKTISEIRSHARGQRIPLWKAAQALVSDKVLTMRANNALVEFLTLIDNMAEHTNTLELHEQMDHVIHQSGLWKYISKTRSEKSKSRLENLEELVTAAKTFVPGDQLSELPKLSAFLSHAALEAGEGQANQSEDGVQLMTLHSAKGLEFPVVYLGGVEEGLFPSLRSIDSPEGLEEERRLCYVGMTRAMQKLYMCHAEVRRIHGREQYHRASRFIKEIPKELVAAVRLQTKVMRPQQSSSRATQLSTGINIPDTPFKLGQRVTHKKYGEGVILNFQGHGEHGSVLINFNSCGEKLMNLAYAKLEACV